MISASTDAGRSVSGWHMRNAHLPARVAEAHSETAYTTDVRSTYPRAGRPAMGAAPVLRQAALAVPRARARITRATRIDQCLPVEREGRELENAHPVLAAYRQHDECANFMRDEVWRTVRPAYQGLVQQIDDHLGRVWEALDALGRFDDTLIVFTSDHGDYLGDHWLGEKELFHDVIAARAR